MTDDAAREWVLPAAIPFADLKGKDLEECVYWLLDAMGAKDLEWRTGGKGAGAADGGRDLEARFFVPSAEGEIIAQRWWVECKGRAGTVEADEVKSAANNALAYEGLDYVVIATNTQFSNPTRDWVKEWQRKHPKPLIQLWDHAQLERYLSRHPDVVLRLFSEALSLEGRLQAMESRFWNKLEFVPPKVLKDLWKARRETPMTSMSAFAAVANEFAHGNITHRPWGAVLGTEDLIGTLAMGLGNIAYLVHRLFSAGAEQRILFRTFSYLILVALDNLTAKNVARLVFDSINLEGKRPMPEKAQDMFLMPIVGQLLSEMQDVCSADCERVSAFNRSTLTEDFDEVDDYWLRLELSGIEEPTEQRILRLEKQDAPCRVGFAVDKDHGCPLFEFEPDLNNVEQLLTIVQRVMAFRKKEAAMQREKDRHEKEIRAKSRPRQTDDGKGGAAAP